LIVIAFTRPFFSSKSAAKTNSGAGATVILVDNSLSMRRDQIFADAQHKAENAVDDARNDEQLALVSFDKRYSVVNRFVTDKNRIRFGYQKSHRRLGRNRLRAGVARCRITLIGMKTTGPKKIVNDLRLPGDRLEPG